MKNVSQLYSRRQRPIKVLQFGEGVFLRAFVDYAIDVANEKNGFDGNIAVILPRAGKTDRFSRQNNIYTVCLRGRQGGEVYKENRVVTAIDRVISARDEYDDFMALAHEDALQFVISNTTDAGITFRADDSFADCPPSTFPAKLTKFLYERYVHYEGDSQKGLVMLPTELNDQNGQLLRRCVLQYAEAWNLGGGFTAWLASSCRFVDTLVDRIVAGYPADTTAELEQELGYKDELLDQAEPFSLWVIGDPSLEEVFPVGSPSFHVEFTNNIQAFKEQKVRILNGAHTSMVLGAYLAGLDYVGQCMADPVIRRQLDATVFGEIVPTVNLPRDKADAFAKAVYERFENPFVKHSLLAISLNSISKWKTRILPTFKDSLAATGKLPKWLTYSLAALLAFYRTTEAGKDCLIGRRADGTTYEIHDDGDKLAFVKNNAAKSTGEYVQAVMSRADFWGEDLTAIPGFAAAVTAHVEGMAEQGVRAYIESLTQTA